MPREKKDKGKGKAQGPYDKAEPAAEEDPAKKAKHVPVPRPKPGAMPWTPRDPSFFARLHFREPEELALGQRVFPQAGPSTSSGRGNTASSAPSGPSSSSGSGWSSSPPSASGSSSAGPSRPSMVAAPAATTTTSSPPASSSPQSTNAPQGEVGETDWAALCAYLATLNEEALAVIFSHNH